MNTIIARRHAKKVVAVYGIGVLGFLMILYTPFSVPCLFKLAAGMPCPACGLTRAFVLAGQFRLTEALAVNILFLPVAAGLAAYFLCAMVTLVLNKNAIAAMNTVLAKRWVIALAAAGVLSSWGYNIARGI